MAENLNPQDPRFTQGYMPQSGVSQSRLNPQAQPFYGPPMPPAPGRVQLSGPVATQQGEWTQQGASHVPPGWGMKHLQHLQQPLLMQNRQHPLTALQKGDALLNAGAGRIPQTSSHGAQILAQNTQMSASTQQPR